MNLSRVIAVALLAGLTAGCASGVHRDLPACDGTQRRPLNPAMWQWRENDLLREPAGSSTSHKQVSSLPATEPAEPCA